MRDYNIRWERGVMVLLGSVAGKYLILAFACGRVYTCTSIRRQCHKTNGVSLGDDSP
jgi:hypothetical protein